MTVSKKRRAITKAGGVHLFVGDCRSIAVALAVRHSEADLTFLDLPSKDAAPGDGLSRFVTAGVRVTKAKGVLALHGSDDTCERCLRYMSQHQPKWSRVAWITLAWNHGCQPDKGWTSTKTHCLVYTQDPSRAKWYPDEAASTFKSGGLRVPGDVWGIQPDPFFHVPIEPFTSERGFSPADLRRERHGSEADQLPLAFYDRLVRAYTDEGDTVFDLCAGAGGMLLVCKVLKRRVIGIEQDGTVAKSIGKRLKAHWRLAHDRCRVPFKVPGQPVQTTFLSD